MNSNDNYGVGLYYPFINVQNIEWLKTALLYWDTIRCITPSSEFFIPDIKYLHDEGCILPTNPQKYSLNASVTFAKKMHSYCFDQGQLDHKALDYLHENFPDLEDLSLHSEKFSEQIFEQMGHKVLLGNIQNGKNVFFTAQPYISALYLTVLANEMSSNIKAPLVTDVVGLSGLYQSIMYSDNLVPSNNSQDDILMQLGLGFPSPKDLMHVSFEDILHFRNTHNAERKRFRKAIEDIRCQAQTIEDINALADYFNDNKNEIDESISDFKKSLKDIGIQRLASSIKASWPALAGFPISHISEIAGIITSIGLAGLSIAITNLSLSNNNRRAIKDCPWSYLLNINQEF